MLHVGRLCTQKQQDLLIDSFTKLIPEFNDWELHILGDGEHYEKLQKKIEQSCTAHHIFLHGKVSDVSTWMEKSHIFCLPSQWEGFPNALAEAMAHGLPCVGFANCAGVRDLIEDGVTGRLVVGENCAESLAIALRELMANMELRKQFGQNALEFTKVSLPKDLSSVGRSFSCTMKCLFAIKRLADVAGGAERVLSTICSELAERGFQVQLLNFDQPDSFPFYPILPKYVNPAWHR